MPSILEYSPVQSFNDSNNLQEGELFFPPVSQIVFFMKKIFLLLSIILICSFILHSQEKESKFVLGVNAMYRYIEPGGNSYFYPRLSLEYRLTRVSSFECMTEYIDYKSYRRFISFPLSAGYKMNIIPWFTKSENLTDRLKVYAALRYTFLPSAANPDKPFEKFYVFHKIRFAPGTEYYFSKKWGANAEMVFGNNMKTTMGLGIRYRF